MKTVLVLSPHFPPVSAADMHRVRISLPHFETFGWHPVVLAVSPVCVNGVLEPGLHDTLPGDLRVQRCGAVPLALTAPLGVSDLGLRAYAHLLAAGARMLARSSVDLVYVSSTVFHAFSLAALWKRLFATPFVLDLQDPWGCHAPGAPHPGAKRRIARAVHRYAESRVAPRADGFVAVTHAYLDALDARYPACTDKPRVVLPFGFSPGDFEVADHDARVEEFFDASDGNAHGVYIGRAGDDMRRALEICFAALAEGMRRYPDVFSRVRLHFIGTDYAPRDRGRPSVAPIAERFGVAQLVSEHPARIPYLRALSLLRRADFLLVPGSEDGRYTASKIFPYILARRPMLAVLHAASSAAEMLEESNATSPTLFAGCADDARCTRDLLGKWHALILDRRPPPPLKPEFLDAFSPRATARAQCALFDEVVASRESAGETLRSST